MNKFSCSEVSWDKEKNKLKQVRYSVFIEEQGVAQELEWDGEDNDSLHFLALSNDKKPIGTARLTSSGQIGRMAVLSELRGNGIGLSLLQLAIRTARKNGMTKVFLHAQEHAIEFYKLEHFVAEGDLFIEAGISHQLMRKKL